MVQKHWARSLHYDFRLEIGTALVSWAVPKGPSKDPKVKRLAIHVEDHPLDYLLFEETLPEGEYGAGTVMVWDRGTYELETDSSAGKQLAEGELKFVLHGQRLKGGFVLIRSNPKSSGSSRRENWLLIKRNDEYADRSWNIDVYDRSVLTGRSLEEIASEFFN